MKKISFKFNNWKISLITFIFSLVFSGSMIAIINTIVGKIDYENPNPSGIQYISERSFSLKITKENTSTVYGTGWLFAKDNSNSLTYYVATNLHVAATLQNANKSFYRKDNSGQYEYIQNETQYEKMEFGQIGKIENNKFTPGTKDTNLESNQIHFYQYIPIYTQNVSNSPIQIAYTSFDMFKNKNINYWTNKEKEENNRNYVYGDETIKNGTLDIAILKINFNSRQWIDSSKQIDTILPALDNFDKNPTKFAKQMTPLWDPVTIAGFPVVLNSKVPEWKSLENRKFFSKQSGSNAFKMYDWRDNIPSETTNETIKKQYALPTHINFVTNEYASYWNVANQYLYDNANLQSGSSGSMAINSNNEVIGIYWGTYQLSDNSIKGVIDSFINTKYENTFLTKYNLLEDFYQKTKIMLN